MPDQAPDRAGVALGCQGLKRRRGLVHQQGVVEPARIFIIIRARGPPVRGEAGAPISHLDDAHVVGGPGGLTDLRRKRHLGAEGIRVEAGDGPVSIKIPQRTAEARFNTEARFERLPPGDIFRITSDFS